MRYRFMRFPDGKEKALTLSYDDGCRADIRLCEILKKYNIKATFNINTPPKNEGEWRLSANEIKKYFLDNGHEIAIHGFNHIAPGSVPAKDGIREVYECRKNLEATFGKIIRGMAYPDTGITFIRNGANLSEIESYLKMLGVVYSRSLNGDNNSFEMPNDWYNWVPTAKHKNPKLFEYLDEFLSYKSGQYISYATPKLFYLWGHSYEFDNDNNWNLIEEFCKRVSGNDDIYFATNIEIYEYTNAYNSLIFSGDNTIAYNPTLIDVWFTIDGKTYKIKSGETITLP